MSKQQSGRPEDGVKSRAGLGAAVVIVMTFALTVPLLVPPPRPALAQRPAASPSVVPAQRPTASPSVVPAPTPSPSTEPQGPSPSPAPSARPSGVPSPLPSPSPSALPSGQTDEEKRIHGIVERMEHLNPQLKDYTAELAIAVNIKAGILRLPMDLQGTCYYKQPDRYKVELKNAPSLLQKYPQIFGYHPIDPNEFNISLRPEETVNGRACWVLRLDKKSATSDFRGQTVWVDKQDFTSPRRVYDYTNNGRIDVRFKWRKEKSFVVMDRAEGDLDFPKFGASANLVATYTGYRLNQGLEDQIFDQKKK